MPKKKKETVEAVETVETAVKVKAVIPFRDLEADKKRRIGDVWACSIDRAKVLEGDNPQGKVFAVRL